LNAAWRGRVLGGRWSAGAVVVWHGARGAARGFRELLLPFIVSPLGVAAALEASLTVSTWGARVTVAAAYTAVVAVNLVAALIFGPLIRLAHPTSLEVLSRLLGILLTAVGVDLSSRACPPWATKLHVASKVQRAAVRLTVGHLDVIS
jgi:hypothetical protein